MIDRDREDYFHTRLQIKNSMYESLTYSAQYYLECGIFGVICGGLFLMMIGLAG